MVRLTALWISGITLGCVWLQNECCVFVLFFVFSQTTSNLRDFYLIVEQLTFSNVQNPQLVKDGSEKANSVQRGLVWVGIFSPSPFPSPESWASPCLLHCALGLSSWILCHCCICPFFPNSFSHLANTAARPPRSQRRRLTSFVPTPKSGMFTVSWMSFTPW